MTQQSRCAILLLEGLTRRIALHLNPANSRTAPNFGVHDPKFKIVERYIPRFIDITDLQNFLGVPVGFSVQCIAASDRGPEVEDPDAEVDTVAEN